MSADAIFKRYLEAHAKFDFDTCLAMLAPDARIYYNYRSIRDTVSAEEAYAAIRPMTGQLQSMEFRFDRPIISTTEAFAIQATARAVTRRGTEFFVPVVYMGRVGSTGLILEYQEYLDPAAMAPLFAEMNAN